MKAFVTGGTGLLGNNLVRALLDNGHDVKALVRSSEKAALALDGLDVEIVIGDMTNVKGFSDALTGCEIAFHTAAYFREYYGRGDHWPHLQAINIDGTRALVEAARARGVERFVNTASGGIIGMKPDGSPGDESTPPAAITRENLYFRSKLEGEQALRRLVDDTGYPVIFALPSWMWGPWDIAPTNASRFVLDLIAGRIPAMVPGGMSIVDVRDVASGMILAAERGRPGDRYILAGAFTEITDLASWVAEASDKAPPKLSIPYPIAVVVSVLSETLTRLTGKANPMPLEGIRALNARMDMTAEKARRELGATFRPVRETVRDTVHWLLDNAGRFPSLASLL